MNPSATPESASMPAVLQRLYVRIWLSVLVVVASLMLLLGWAWRATTDPPARTVVVQNMDGAVIGQGAWRGTRDRDGRVPHDDNGDNMPPDPAVVARYAELKSGPEFLVRMADGQDILIHLPRPPRSQWSRPPNGFFWVLGMVGFGTALVMWPLARRLTRRLERLQRGVERWGGGDLSARVPMSGRDEVGLLAQRFNTAAERIEVLLQSQKSLLANASHELRSPLARIRMALELMGATPTPAIREEIGRNIAELDQLIDEILLASRLDAREADLGTVEEVDWTGLTAEECARMDVAFEVGEAGQEDAAPVQVRGVPKLLRRAVRNLLENARRYGRGEVKATLERSGRQAVLRVFDRGPGVPAALRERIFEPFYRLPGASESNGGVGLGLALVKSIAERHGGRVRCEEREGGGACFVIELPDAA
ncbi:HAMP domain-containing sensor histidine kinase [Pseudorhodoferax sp. Leaf267]|uniref:sensor histidine kinase n=1 Tax=Pseudorhodoferax sp. Leaf267 TaxID=1736316 RepID=UPI001F1C51BE|nr:HAMP domain-containing sensor histidine kinase [Pseudorhodoferax sp. Leaf267]